MRNLNGRILDLQKGVDEAVFVRKKQCPYSTIYLFIAARSELREVLF